MWSRRPALVLAALNLLVAPVVAAQAQSEEFHCRRGDLVRRIEVQFANDADRLPCQVIYWRDVESPDRPRVPWNAQNQLEFCTQKAQEMVENLQSAGWTCEGDAPPSEDAAELAAPTAPERSPRETAAETAPGRGPANGGSGPDRAILQAALTRDMRRLDELAGKSLGEFQPEMATLGDLDGDGLNDGAVLLSHRDADGGSSHHLLAYLFDGTTFRPVARVNVEAYYQNFAEVAIEEIADGGIELLLRTPQAGDPACCPSGRRRATFELQDGQLVLAGESGSGA